jgi:U3 small nucleolar RNA-associated protein 10
VSNNYSDHLDALLSKLRDCNPHVRVLGYLITRALLVRLSGEHQIDAAHKVLEVMRLEQLASIEDFPRGADKLKDVGFVKLFRRLTF